MHRLCCFALIIGKPNTIGGQEYTPGDVAVGILEEPAGPRDWLRMTGIILGKIGRLLFREYVKYDNDQDRHVQSHTKVVVRGKRKPKHIGTPHGSAAERWLLNTKNISLAVPVRG